MLVGKKIGIGITGSFCSINKVPKILEDLVEMGADVYIFASEKVLTQDTRFANAKEYINKIENIVGKKVVRTTVEAEEYGPKIQLDLMCIIPMTGTSLGKFANSINDNAPLLASKATLRNGKPVLIGVMTNDGLGVSGENIMKLMSMKNIFFMPFGQDDIIRKKNSLTCNFEKAIESIEKALEYKQIQPVIIEHK